MQARVIRIKFIRKSREACTNEVNVLKQEENPPGTMIRFWESGIIRVLHNIVKK